ncbi:hypothetical protein CAG70_03260 [Photobacterium halotolerans]|uniref:hypothetical protein n=1 Tax=Photobacterium halotolerans TaxID=265726 RepID=UPI001372C3EE|nr:hypothetical protein [Photobacterium halotolerans]NAX46021.1 hypothetical protein [Photobacterium halotolerans]
MKKAALIALAAFHRKLAGILTDDVSFITLCLFTEQKRPTVHRDGKSGILPERYPLQCSLLTKISPHTEKKLTSTLMTAISAGLDTVLAASSDFFCKNTNFIEELFPDSYFFLFYYNHPNISQKISYFLPHTYSSISL